MKPIYGHAHQNGAIRTATQQRTRLSSALLTKGERGRTSGCFHIDRALEAIRFEEVRVAVKIPPDYAARGYELKNAGTLEQDEWQKDGSWIAVVRIPAGIQEEFYDLVNKISKGNAETRIIERVL